MFPFDDVIMERGELWFKFHLKLSNWQKVSIGLDYGRASNRWQAIAWNDVMAYWRISTTISVDELN